MGYSSAVTLGSSLRDTHLPRLFRNWRILNFSIYFVGMNPSVIANEKRQRKQNWSPGLLIQRDHQQEYSFSHSDICKSHCWDGTAHYFPLSGSQTKESSLVPAVGTGHSEKRGVWGIQGTFLTFWTQNPSQWCHLLPGIAHLCIQGYSTRGVTRANPASKFIVSEEFKAADTTLLGEKRMHPLLQSLLQNPDITYSHFSTYHSPHKSVC